MSGSAEMIGLVGGFVASAFALVRFALCQNKALTERFMGFLENAVERQERANGRFENALNGLSANVQEHTNLLSRLAERM